ncbi:MAG: hypothetical protein ACXVB0_16110 [Mucilaginibacter sp.]
MKQQEVFKKIGSIIKELNDQYDYLATTKDDLNDLELELFVANAHFLADHSEVLRKLNLQNTPTPVITPPPIITREEKYFEPVVQQAKPSVEIEEETTDSLAPDTPAKPIETERRKAAVEDSPTPHIDLAANGADDDFSYIREEPETIRHELTLEDIPNWEDEEDEGFVSEELTDSEEEIIEIPPPPPLKKVAPVKPVEPVKPIVVEKAQPKVKVQEPQEEPLTINQKMSAQLSNAGSRVTEHLNIQPIADLKQAITLNDKLLYIKDLFNGYNLAYSEAIDILNRFSTFDEADKFLKDSYAAKNHWENKEATVDKFYTLLRRRYS